MRWLYLNQKLDQNMLFGYGKADETRRRFIIPLWNVYAFFVTYARIDGWEPPAALRTNPAPQTARVRSLQSPGRRAPLPASWTAGSSPGCARRSPR
jgi:hypothetical protein